MRFYQLINSNVTVNTIRCPGYNTARKKLVQIAQLLSSAESNISVTPVWCSFKRDKLVTFFCCFVSFTFYCLSKGYKKLKISHLHFLNCRTPCRSTKIPFFPIVLFTNDSLIFLLHWRELAKSRSKQKVPSSREDDGQQWGMYNKVSSISNKRRAKAMSQKKSVELVAIIQVFFIQTAKNIANMYIGCDKSFLRCVFQSRGIVINLIANLCN